MKLATWNLRSLYARGALQNTLTDLNKYKIHIAAVQETRWLDKGIHTMANHSFYFSGKSDGKHEFGTGFIVNKMIDHTIIGFVPVSQYISTLRFKMKTRKVTMLNVHAPTESRDEDVKDAFYHQLESVYNSIPNSDLKIVLGDFNAQIGREECYKEVVGVHSLHSLSNDNGSRAVHFAVLQGLTVRSTQFQRKDIHKVTWRSNDGSTRNQIDHVMIENKYRSSIYDVRSCRGTLHESDHFLMIIKMRGSYTRYNNKMSTARAKYNVDKLKSEETRSRFETKVQELLTRNQADSEINEAIKNTNTILSQAAEEVLGTATARNIAGYFDEECLDAVKQKKDARIAMQQRNTRGNVSKYNRKSIQAYRLLRKKKREHLNKEIENLEELSRGGNVRDFYKSVKTMRKGFQAKSMKILNDQGELLSDKNLIVQRWKEYFQNLLNRPQIAQTETQIYQGADPEILAPSYEEVVEAIFKQKNCKAPGEDNIPSELIKAAGQDLWQRLHQIITMVWENEHLPDAWTVGLMIPIHKKGNRMVCENFRGICLLNTAYKILATILYDRLSVYTEEILGDYQCGFRAGRSTTDQIFTIRQIMEKAWEYNIAIHQLFLDFKQAYDSIDRNVLFNIMEEFGIPAKLIRLTKATLTDTKCKILLQNILSDNFTVDTGVRQGDRLSTLLFNLALEKVVRAMSINWKGTIFNTSKQLAAFADDADLLGRGVLAVKESFVEAEKEGKKVGLVVSENKTKYLTLDRKNGSRIGQNITIDEYNFEVVQSFKYLGSILNITNDVEEEIKTRIIQGNRCFYALKHLFRSSLLNMSTKYRLYKTTIRSVVMYSSETWSLTLKQENTLKCFERKIQRAICGPVQEGDLWRQRTNMELKELFGDENIIGAIKSARLRWAGHMIRMDDSRVAKKVFLQNVEGVRAKGRPRKRWIDGVEEDLEKLQVVNWGVVSADRHLWRQIVESAKTRLG